MTATDPLSAVQPEPAAQPTTTTTAGLNPKVAGLLAYLFGWLGGLIIFLTQKDPEVRFHGAQSLLFTIAYTVVSVGAFTLMGIAGAAQSAVLAALSGLFVFAVMLGFFVTWIVMCVKGYGLEHTKLPLIGNMAERWAK